MEKKVFTMKEELKKKEIELADTVSMMSSANYKERFKAEYYQLAIRLVKLEAMLDKWKNGKLDFIPTCSMKTYDEQIDGMKKYLSVLNKRAEEEKIDLEWKIKA